MKTIFLFLLVIFVACDASSPDATIPANVRVKVDALNAGGQVDAAQTLVAQAQNTVTLATAIAQATREMRDATATRDALDLQYARITEAAVARRETAVAQQGATSYAAMQMAKTETAIAQNKEEQRKAANQTVAANTGATALAMAQTAKTENAQRTATAQARVDASATYVAEAPTRVAIARAQADEEVQRAQTEAVARAEAEMTLKLAPYLAALKMFAIPAILLLLAIVLLVSLLLWLRAAILERTNSALTKRVITDLKGTPVGFLTEATDGSWMIEPIPAPVPQIPPPQSETTSENKPPAEQPPGSNPPEDDLLRVNNSRGGDTFISRDTPEENEAKVRKMLALRLLRDAMQYYAHRNLDTRVGKIPSHRDLEWSSETWVRAVDSLKPFVIAKSGRNGGTFCAPEYPHLVALYDAVGQNKVIPRASPTVPLPARTLIASAA